jgi:hypothetical protein
MDYTSFKQYVTIELFDEKSLKSRHVTFDQHMSFDQLKEAARKSFRHIKDELCDEDNQLKLLYSESGLGEYRDGSYNVRSRKKDSKTLLHEIKSDLKWNEAITGWSDDTPARRNRALVTYVEEAAQYIGNPESPALDVLGAARRLKNLLAGK